MNIRPGKKQDLPRVLELIRNSQNTRRLLTKSSTLSKCWRKMALDHILFNGFFVAEKPERYHRPFSFSIGDISHMERAKDFGWKTSS